MGGLVYGVSHLSGEQVTTEFWGRVFPVGPLQGAIERVLEGQPGHFAVVVESLHDSEGYLLDEKDSFPLASLYKLILMAAIMEEIQLGKLKLEDRVFNDTDYLAGRLGGVDFGYQEVSGRVEYSVEEALRRVATISDNYAAIMLTDRLGEQADGRLEMTAGSLGMMNTHFGEDLTTTASDIAQFFRSLYHGQVVSRESSDQIIDWLAGSKLNDRIPALLPAGVKVAHKTGELARTRHDAGIVLLEGKPYLIVIMSKDLQGEDTAVDAIANLSLAVYQYFEKKQLAEPAKK